MSERGWWEFNDSSFCCLFTAQLCWFVKLVKQKTDEDSGGHIGWLIILAIIVSLLECHGTSLSIAKLTEGTNAA